MRGLLLLALCASAARGDAAGFWSSEESTVAGGYVNITYAQVAGDAEQAVAVPARAALTQLVAQQAPGAALAIGAHVLVDEDPLTGMTRLALDLVSVGTTMQVVAAALKAGVAFSVQGRPVVWTLAAPAPAPGTTMSLLPTVTLYFAGPYSQAPSYFSPRSTPELMLQVLERQLRQPPFAFLPDVDWFADMPWVSAHESDFWAVVLPLANSLAADVVAHKLANGLDFTILHDTALLRALPVPPDYQPATVRPTHPGTIPIWVPTTTTTTTPTTPNPTPQSHTKHKTPEATIVGVVLGAVALAAIVALACVIVRKRRKTSARGRYFALGVSDGDDDEECDDDDDNTVHVRKEEEEEEKKRRITREVESRPVLLSLFFFIVGRSFSFFLFLSISFFLFLSLSFSSSFFFLLVPTDGGKHGRQLVADDSNERCQPTGVERQRVVVSAWQRAGAGCAGEAQRRLHQQLVARLGHGRLQLALQPSRRLVGRQHAVATQPASPAYAFLPAGTT